MGEDVGVPRARLLDDRADLLFAVLQVPDRVIRRGDAARGQDLDLSRPFAQLVAGGAAAFGNAIGDARESRTPFTAGASDDRLGPRPHITVPASLAQGTARGEDARPAAEALF